MNRQKKEINKKKYKEKINQLKRIHKEIKPSEILIHGPDGLFCNNKKNIDKYKF